MELRYDFLIAGVFFGLVSITGCGPTTKHHSTSTVNATSPGVSQSASVRDLAQFPSAVSTALSWVQSHQPPGPTGLPQPAGPLVIPRSPTRYFAEQARLTPNGFAIQLQVVSHALPLNSPLLETDEQRSMGTIAWQVNLEGLGANIPQYVMGLNSYWRRPAAVLTTITLADHVRGHRYAFSTTEAIGNPVQPISVLTWQQGPWTMEILGGTTGQEDLRADQLITYIVSHHLPKTVAGVIAIHLTASPQPAAATTQIDWMAPNYLMMMQVSDTVATVDNPIAACQLIASWSTVRPRAVQ